MDGLLPALSRNTLACPLDKPQLNYTQSSSWKIATGVIMHLHTKVTSGKMTNIKWRDCCLSPSRDTLTCPLDKPQLTITSCSCNYVSYLANYIRKHIKKFTIPHFMTKALVQGRKLQSVQSCISFGKGSWEPFQNMIWRKLPAKLGLTGDRVYKQ